MAWRQGEAGGQKRHFFSSLFYASEIVKSAKQAANYTVTKHQQPVTLLRRGSLEGPPVCEFFHRDMFGLCGAMFGGRLGSTASCRTVKKALQP